MFDISAAGAWAEIEFGGSSGSNSNKITVKQFSDEGTPFESPNITLSTNAKNLQGSMISSRTPSVVPVSITVVPGSKEDYFLQKRVQDALLQPGGVTAISNIVVKSLTLHVPAIDGSKDITTSSENTGSGNTYTWINGRMTEAPTGPSTSAEGRMSARTYSFEFEKYQGPTGTFIDVDSIQKAAANL